MSDPRLFETDGPQVGFNIYDPEEVVKKMMETPGLEFGFNIEAKDPRPERTISKEASDNLRDMMGAWVMTRLHRHWQRTGRGAKKIQVHVVVSLDGQPPEFSDTVPFFSWPDGEHRDKAQGHKRD